MKTGNCLDTLDQRRTVAALILYYHYYHDYCSEDIKTILPTFVKRVREKRAPIFFIESFARSAWKIVCWHLFHIISRVLHLFSSNKYKKGGYYQLSMTLFLFNYIIIKRRTYTYITLLYILLHKSCTSCLFTLFL